MKKSILVILLVLLAFSLWSVLAIAKEKVAQKPTQVQQTEPNVGPEAFPEVMLPQAQPVRMTQEDFKKEILDKQGLTMDQLKSRGTQITEAGLEPAEKELVPTLCTISNATTGGYRSGLTLGTPWIRCYGEVLIAVYMNPEDSLFGNPSCPQPIYPFMAKQVMMAINIGDTATFLFQPEIREALYDPSGVAYPGNVLLTGPVYNQHYASIGTFSTYFSLGDSVCLYKPWFGVMHILNTDDFSDNVDSTLSYCWPGFMTYLSTIFDISGRAGQNYLNVYGPGGSWYDLVKDLGESGVYRVRVRGYNRSENTCVPPADPWYFKDSLLAAPCGVPDFDQYQMPGPAFCGPTAEANSYWWLNAKWGFDMIPGSPSVPAIIQEIAAAAGTNPVTGTDVNQLEAAILQVIQAHGGWWFTETTVYNPNFWWLQKELKKCEDLTLLLGFWQFDGANWTRFGGHFVTIAGVDIFSTPPRFAISDPALDKAEAMSPNPVFGKVCHTDPFPHVGSPLVHNNPANTSHDYYDVAWPSASPGGLLYLPGYVPYDSIRWDTTIICDPIPPENHFKTWRTIPEPFGTTVFVHDQFMDDSIRLIGLEFLSNPVEKVVQNDTFDIIKPNDHLTWYRAVGRDTSIRVEYVNQFESTTVAIDSVRYLLVPTQKLPHDPPVGLDHYKAYRIKDPVAFNVNEVVLEDQFDLLYGLPELIYSLKPIYFLTPALKNTPGPMFDSKTHYVAYEIFPKLAFPISVSTFDQFGEHLLQVLNSELLLVPTKKCYTRITGTPIPRWGDFQGQNAGPFPNTGTYDTLFPVTVEVEAVVDVSPGDPYQYCDLTGGNNRATITNYGRLGPQTGKDFVWPTSTDTTNQLFDGSLCIGTSGANMAVSVTSGKGYKPIDPCSVTDEVLYVNGADSLKAQVGRARYSSIGNPDIRVTQTTYDFTWTGDAADPINSAVLHEFKVENAGISPILGISQGLFHDFDINRHGGYNLGGGDSTLNTIWQDDTAGAVLITLVPETPGLISPNGTLGEQNNYLYNEVPGPYDSLYALMNVPNWDTPNTAPPDFDWGVLLVQPKYDLAPGTPKLNSYFMWGYEGLPDSSIGNTKMNKDAQHKLFYLLKWKGFYRGDVNCDGKLDVADVIYMINYLFKGGPKPKPMVNQGDVNNDTKTDVADVIYIINRLFKGGPAPWDKDRFMAGAVARPGLFGDPQWKTLGQ